MNERKVEAWYESEKEKIYEDFLETVEKDQSKEAVLEAEKSYKTAIKELRDEYAEKMEQVIKENTEETIKNIKGEGWKNKFEAWKEQKEVEAYIREPLENIEQMRKEYKKLTKKTKKENEQLKEQERKRIRRKVKYRKLISMRNWIRHRYKWYKKKYYDPTRSYIRQKKNELIQNLEPYKKKINEWFKSLFA